jgi:uncharacterized protein
MTGTVKLRLDQAGKGSFYIPGESGDDGLIEISISGNNITAHHTEVAPHAEGKGLAKKMLAAMVDYARKNELKVIPVCPFVRGQFKKNPGEYHDIWNKAMNRGQ